MSNDNFNLTCPAGTIPFGCGSTSCGWGSDQQVGCGGSSSIISSGTWGGAGGNAGDPIAGDRLLTSDGCWCATQPTWNNYYSVPMDYTGTNQIITIKEGEMGKVCPVTGKISIEKTNCCKGEKKMACAQKYVYEYELTVLNLAHDAKERVLLNVKDWVEINSSRTLHDVVLVKHASALAKFAKDAEHLAIKVKVVDTQPVECKD